jgi:anti-sigma factor RsiW
MRFTRKSEPREEELAALADGSLPPERRPEVEAMIARSPELALRLEEQRRAVDLVRGAAATIEAPAGLRTRVERDRPARTARAPRTRRRVWAAGLAGAAVAAVALALVLTLPGNVPGAPSVAEAAVLTTRPPTEPAPPPKPGTPTLLARAVDGVPYPNWTAKFGWKAVGSRVDTLDGRRATTVYYAKNGRRIGYTIFAGSPLDVPEDAVHVVREGTDLSLLTVDGRPVVTWLRSGHTCILSGADVPKPILEKLAAWNGKGTVPF